MADDRWYRIDLPILEYVQEHGGPFELLSVGYIAQAMGLDPTEVAVGLDNLSSAHYLAGRVQKPMTGGDPSPWFLEDSSLGERGLRVVGAWPSDDPYEALVKLLERHIAATSDEEKKSKLKALERSVTEVGKATIAGLLVEFAKGTIRF
jgi:hypothetical protein